MQSEEALADTIRLWAREHADAIDVSDLRHKLLWDAPVGKHGDDLTIFGSHSELT